MPKIKVKQRAKRHDPLHVEILRDNEVKPMRTRNKKLRTEDETKEYIDTRTTKRILKEAVAQKNEQIDRDAQMDMKQQIENAIALLEETEEDLMNPETEAIDKLEYEEEMSKLTEEEEALLQNAFTQDNLGDMILKNIQEKIQPPQTTQDFIQKTHPKIVQAYKKVGSILKKYRGGKLPKAFTVLPTLANWEELLFLTDPEGWSPQAVYAATNIFASGPNRKIAQRFYNTVLLNRVRLGLADSRKLNFHIYRALKKACFRAAEFFKGIVLPLCENECTLREAQVVGAVIKTTKIPIVDSSVALMKIATMEFNQRTTTILKSLIDKRYALPTQVVDALVEYFYRFVSFKDKTTVLWHQTLLSFVETYKTNFSKEQKKKILQVCRAQTHHAITPVVRKELSSKHSKFELNRPRLEDVEMK